MGYDYFSINFGAGSECFRDATGNKAKKTSSGIRRGVNRRPRQWDHLGVKKKLNL